MPVTSRGGERKTAYVRRTTRVTIVRQQVGDPDQIVLPLSDPFRFAADLVIRKVEQFRSELERKITLTEIAQTILAESVWLPLVLTLPPT